MTIADALKMGLTPLDIAELASVTLPEVLADNPSRKITDALTDFRRLIDQMSFGESVPRELVRMAALARRKGRTAAVAVGDYLRERLTFTRELIEDEQETAAEIGDAMSLRCLAAFRQILPLALSLPVISEGFGVWLDQG